MANDDIPAFDTLIDEGSENDASDYGSTPDWYGSLTQLKETSGQIDFASRSVTDKLIKKQEVAMKHQDNNSVVKIDDDGRVLIFADNELGIIIDPKTQSINLVGQNLNLMGNNVQVKSDMNHFSWNGYPFNPQMYYESETEKGLTLSGQKQKRGDNTKDWQTTNVSVSPFLPKINSQPYTDGLIDMLKNLGLPVESEE